MKLVSLLSLLTLCPLLFNEELFLAPSVPNPVFPNFLNRESLSIHKYRFRPKLIPLHAISSVFA